ncbi:LysR family transcriptional regulator [Yersinia frederiksenii]|uniref:LysR family transcriptional regulator n=2 Tax=Yersinia frederiksenii TaxID=29484 RepID=A0A380PPP6_YERFR|nr:LysR family transcriptional regulator [Yersinia frederiksenii]ATM95856.1 LysR family transcriptional regulator [Yersinia frederiksenii]EEQ13374.1 transcriptional regulator LYSR-type [Yersinia frederiksenii ATCC 33641]KGA44765.1 bacterial regulatory helix-turn-helix, lysR family protein [Yersinia frederiksenii ATCC 33641]CFQ83944.1 LysR family transcriptional regulator [Yersinia frederiksenii]CNG31930.1 LysR family transcriptional regulator [Yersinia frederiksenii]
MSIELRHLRYFIAVAEELHFGRAAERLRISQPPLSQQIQILEQQIGARLLARNNRNVSLTQAGTLFLKESYQILAQVNSASEKAARLHRGESGELTIGFTSSAPFISAVSKNLRAFRQLHPQVHIKMQEVNTKQQIEPLLDGRLDLGVMRNTRLPDALQYRLLLREPLVAVVHEEHPLAALPSIKYSSLAEQPFVFFAREVGTALYDEILTLLARAGITPYITQEVGEAMTIVGLVSSGLGVSILPASFTRVKVDGVKYLPLAEASATTEVWLVNHKHRPVTAPAEALIRLMVADLPSLASYE